MKNLFVLGVFCIFAQQIHAAVPKAKAAELTSHRVDRLVTLAKIDAGFLKKMAKIEISLVPNAAPTYFRALVSQTQPVNDKALQLEILLDENGKALSYKVLPGGSPGENLNWPTKDAGTLTENSLHYVLDNAPVEKTLQPYLNDLTDIVLSKDVLNGETVAVGILNSSAQPQKLKVYLKTDGTFIKAEIVP